MFQLILYYLFTTHTHNMFSLATKFMIKFPTKFTSINILFPRSYASLRSLAINPCNSIKLFNEQKSSSRNTPAVIVFDEETSGLSRKYDRIIEFAARDLRGGINSTFQTLINPEIHVRNSHVHGITTQMVCKPNVPRYLICFYFLIYIYI